MPIWSSSWTVRSRNFLRSNTLSCGIGAYELAHCLEVPYKVAINEAVELAKSFGGTDGHKYVNGVLDHLAPGLRPDEVKAARSSGGKGRPTGGSLSVSFQPTQPAVTEPHEVDVVGRPVAPDDSDTLEQTRPLPLEPEVADARRERPISCPAWATLAGMR